jgi:hypothetical protein
MDMARFGREDMHPGAGGADMLEKKMVGKRAESREQRAES